MSKIRQHIKSGTWWEETTCEPLVYTEQWYYNDTLNKHMTTQARPVWFRMQASDGCLWTNQHTFKFHRVCGTSNQLGACSSSSFTHLFLGLLKSAFNKYELHTVGLKQVLIQFYLCWQWWHLCGTEWSQSLNTINVQLALLLYTWVAMEFKPWWWDQAPPGRCWSNTTK